MALRAIVDRFENGYVILEVNDNEIVQIPKENAPVMLAEGMIVEYEGDRITLVDHEATLEREDELRRRFERLLKKNMD